MNNKEPDIEELYNRYCKRLYFTSLRIVGDSFQAEEIMHDTFIRYHTFAHKDQIRELEKWLVSVCIRKSIDLLRSRNSYTNIVTQYSNEAEDVAFDDCNDLTSNEPEASPLNKYDGEQHYNVEKIRAALESLDDKYRMVVSLYLFEGFDYAEIADITGIKEVSLRSIYARGKAKLQQQLRSTTHKTEHTQK